MVTDIGDNRHIISLEELREEENEEKKEVETENEKSGKEEGTNDPYLSDEDIKNYLERYRGRIPSVILRDIYEMLKGRRVTEMHIDKIIEKVEKSLDTDNQLRKIDDIYKKLESLEKVLKIKESSDKIGIDISEKKKTEEEAKIEEGIEQKAKDEKIEDGIKLDVKEKVKEDKEVKSSIEVNKKSYPETQVQAHLKSRHYDSHLKKEIPKYPARRDRTKDRIREMLIRKSRGELEKLRKSGKGGAEKMERLYDVEFEREPEVEEFDYGYYGHEYDMPRLIEIPNDAKSIMLLLKWVEFLMERVGYEGLEDILNYYVDVNWISEDVLMAILRYARGIKLYHENSDWRPVGYMNVQDHLMSLLYIEALRTGRFDRHLIMEVEKDLYRMKKEVTELHGV